MEITIVQAVLIGLWTGVCLSGMLLGIYTNRCLIMATGVGLILGDLPTGLAMGAVGELAFMEWQESAQQQQKHWTTNSSKNSDFAVTSLYGFSSCSAL